MIIATGKQYNYLGDNTYVEDLAGACIGVEWQDTNGNSLRMICVDTLCFSFRAKYAELLYEVYIKPVGIEQWCFVKSHIEPLGSDTYFCDNIESELFGKQELEPFYSEGVLKPGIVSQVQFFVNNFIVNRYGLPVSFKQFIYQLISNMYELTIVE